MLLSFDGGDASGFLRRVLPAISSGAERHENHPLNVAFTAAGLAALGLSADAQAEFPLEFRQGMAHPERARRLGDVGEDACENWDFGGALGAPVHALLFVYARTQESLNERLDTLQSSFARWRLAARRLETYWPEDGREHFGFRMAVSEPTLTRKGQRQGRARVAPGEFLLGHRNGLGERTPSPSAPFVRSTRDLPLFASRGRIDLGLNGSFLVVRKLEQRVPSFWAFAQAQAERVGETDPAAVVREAARLVGRWPNGASLALYPETQPRGLGSAEPPFGYRAIDPEGGACPFGAHVRRVNPRDHLGSGAQLHRLLRRGRLYGPKVQSSSEEAGDPRERGLVFTALNADIGRQFETIQGSFVNESRFAGSRGERDPLVGRDSLATEGDVPRSFSVLSETVRRVTCGFGRFVRMRGGVYAFLPSLRALNYLAELRPTERG